MKKSINLEFYSPEVNNKLNVWLSEEGVSAGFPSPANDFKELRISLDKVVVKNEAATFYARVVGQSMIDAGIDDGDLIVIDKSLEPKDGKIAVCFIDGEFKSPFCASPSLRKFIRVEHLSNIHLVF